MGSLKDEPWEHPDWYDLHDTNWTAGPEREPEHYRELVVALPPLDVEDHLVDVGAGTGKLACKIAEAYPRLGRVSLVEPNEVKLETAESRVRELLPDAEVRAFPFALGADAEPPRLEATIATVGSVLMPMMEISGGSLARALDWLRAALDSVRSWMGPGATLFALETLAAPWHRGNVDGPARRLHMGELVGELSRVFDSVECAYRFRDRVVLTGRAPRL